MILAILRQDSRSQALIARHQGEDKPRRKRRRKPSPRSDREPAARGPGPRAPKWSRRHPRRAPLIIPEFIQAAEAEERAGTKPPEAALAEVALPTSRKLTLRPTRPPLPRASSMLPHTSRPAVGRPDGPTGPGRHGASAGSAEYAG